ncbi:MAG: glutamine-hydrolyzing GMP synthase [Spirochaetaceae bacterium]|jgi:GMP synthase (glutamine-hydrolysing)|nr:glutamine-hydrolyzing GMP synthase [Spirochaetaceae bacterium]
MDTILILDFGSQTTQLIGRRIRDMGVYAEIVPGDAPLADPLPAEVRGIVLSGSPESAYAPEGPVPDKRIYACGLPLLGICYGLQRMTADLGGQVEALPKREYGGAKVAVYPPPEKKLFFAGFDASVSLLDIQNRRVPNLPETVSITAWMSHGDTLTRLAPGFREYGRSAAGFPAVVVHESKPWYGLQFHPEAAHCERGSEILAGFVFGVCSCKPEWTMERYLENARADLAKKAGHHPVLLLISGGVDSAVVAGLLLKTLPAEQAHLMYIDTGLMRKDETETVEISLKRLGAGGLHIVRSEEAFLAALKGVADPEAKRKIIGDLFIEIQEREVKALGLPETYFLAQGTLYTDLIESGKGVGNKARVIKSHHNVGSPLVEAKRRAGRLIEPLDRLYKDEVRRLGAILGLDEAVIRRHPFPGPGLAVRILGEVTRSACAILREAEALYISELHHRGLYGDMWQAFAVLLPVRSVGVAGDERRYGRVLALRAITSADGMTADVYPFPMKDLLEISTLITNTVPEIGRVVYDISSKPPATIEWE